MTRDSRETFNDDPHLLQSSQLSFPVRDEDVMSVRGTEAETSRFEEIKMKTQETEKEDKQTKWLQKQTKQRNNIKVV